MKMHLVGQCVNNPCAAGGSSVDVVEYSDCIATAINVLISITETACEHAADLNLMRLINFMDLYRVYLADPESEDANQLLSKTISEPGATVLDAQLGSTTLVSFEQFIGDSRLLAVAAAIASAESGETVAAPAPLQLSANTDLDASC